MRISTRTVNDVSGWPAGAKLLVEEGAKEIAGRCLVDFDVISGAIANL